MLITARVPRNVPIVTETGGEAREDIYVRPTPAKRRPIISFGSRARPLIIPYKVIFVTPPRGDGVAEGRRRKRNTAGKRHLESPRGL